MVSSDAHGRQNKFELRFQKELRDFVIMSEDEDGDEGSISTRQVSVAPVNMVEGLQEGRLVKEEVDEEPETIT